MPRKIRQLITDLEQAGFTLTPAKGSHQKFRHASGKTVIVSGHSGDDAHHYQEKLIQRAIKETS